MNIISPCKELVMANRYLKATVDELKLRSPNNHVIPSKGRMTAEALTPAFTFPSCVLFCTCRVPIIWRITRMNTTIFICMKDKFVNSNVFLMVMGKSKDFFSSTRSTANAHVYSYCELVNRLHVSQTQLCSLFYNQIMSS